MYSFGGSLFGSKVSIARECEVVFVADMFAEDYGGGAELTSEALIKSSPFRVQKLRAKDVTLQLLEDGHEKFWVFGNATAMDQSLVPTIAANMKYAVLEYDYKYCQYRSPEKHQSVTTRPCDCQNRPHGKMMSAFFYAAKSLWWMSEAQQARYHMMFPFLADRPNCVLSSVFDDETFAKLKTLREAGLPRSDNWVVLGSASWIKGADAAEEWCRQNDVPYEVVWNLPYDDLLMKLATSKGHVYLPKGGDTCPRMTIEARLLGCELHLNENVQHAKEEWFDTDDSLLTESYLYAARERFWSGIKHDMEYCPSLSGYTTTRNCIAQDYPFDATIKSMLGFCDEVVVVDAGSTDGTWEKLTEWAQAEPKLKPHSRPRDYTDKRFALFDGQLKAEARSLCTSDFCWQMDSDEVLHERDFNKVKKLLTNFPKECDMMVLPVVEFWGGRDKVRVDVNVWKWRLSRNASNITHGVPKDQRRFDSDGRLFSAGSDGCDLIDARTHEPIPFLTFVTPDIDAVRQQSVFDDSARGKYEKWLSGAVDALPSVLHFSWWNIGRKMRTYRDYWQAHWESISNKHVDDTPESNMFFEGRAWKDVTEADIDAQARRLKEEMGGWVFHHRVDFSRPTKSVKLDVDIPECVREWTERNGMR